MDYDALIEEMSVRQERWDRRYLGLSQHVASWSKDPSTKVGAVLVSPQNKVVSLGYNGFPRGVNDDPARYSNRPEKYKRVVHAEANAILSANTARGCTIYSSLLTCNECAKLVIQSGVSRVVSFKPPTECNWQESIELALEMYAEAGVKVTLYE